MNIKFSTIGLFLSALFLCQGSLFAYRYNPFDGIKKLSDLKRVAIEQAERAFAEADEIEDLQQAWTISMVQVQSSLTTLSSMSGSGYTAQRAKILMDEVSTVYNKKYLEREEQLKTVPSVPKPPWEKNGQEEEEDDNDIPPAPPIDL